MAGEDSLVWQNPLVSMRPLRNIRAIVFVLLFFFKTLRLKHPQAILLVVSAWLYLDNAGELFK